MKDAAGSEVRFACRGCGKPIVLSPSDLGTVIADAREFLAAHGGCLTKSAVRR